MSKQGSDNEFPSIRDYGQRPGTEIEDGGTVFVLSFSRAALSFEVTVARDLAVVRGGFGKATLQ